MAHETRSLLEDVGRYYSRKLEEHGATPRGVDWNGAESQALRFEQLMRIADGTGGFSLVDLGCGYGALYDYVAARFPSVTYMGTDISTAMIETARHRLGSNPSCRFQVGARPEQPADYAVASGLFNVRLHHDEVEWHTYMLETLQTLDASSRRGFAFNCLTRYSDIDKMRSDLYYADPLALFDHCKRTFSSHVALLHDYGLYEFTMLVRKQP